MTLRTRNYLTIATARSALSSVIILENGQKFGDHPLVKQFMKGIFNQKPSQPRYKSTWDTTVVTNIFKTEAWNPIEVLSLLELTMKTVMLILVATLQRGQTILAFLWTLCIRMTQKSVSVQN